MKKSQVVASGIPEEILTKGLIGDVFGVDCETYINPVTGELGIAYLDSVPRVQEPIH
ncbi:hypothetical protein D3C71_2081330 [compost metagenome]